MSGAPPWLEGTRIRLEPLSLAHLPAQSGVVRKIQELRFKLYDEQQAWLKTEHDFKDVAKMHFAVGSGVFEQLDALQNEAEQRLGPVARMDKTAVSLRP